MNITVYYCETHYRGALVGALTYLGVLEDESLTLGRLLRLTWWSRIANLIPGQLLEIGSDGVGTRIYILSVTTDKELIPRIAQTLISELKKETVLEFVDALPKKNSYIKWGRWLSIIPWFKSLAHYFFLVGILKLRKEALNKKVSRSLVST